MLFHLPLLKIALLWLTTAVSFLGIVPKFECVCPNGSKQTLLFSANCGCPKAITVEAVSAEGHCPKCHPPKGESPATESQCRKSMIAAESAVVTDATSLDSQIIACSPIFEPPFPIVHAPSLKRSIAADQSLPTPDLIIALRHLVI